MKGPVEGHAVGDGAHAVLPYAEVKVPAQPVLPGEGPLVIDESVVGGSKVRGPTHQARQRGRKSVDDLAGGGSCRHALAGKVGE